jgi:hypothetical protein
MWSPGQIAGWLKRTYPDGENDKVSHPLNDFTNPLRPSVESASAERRLVDHPKRRHRAEV